MQSFDQNNLQDQVRMLEILLTSAVIGNGGRLELTRANTNQVLDQNLTFDFNPDPFTGNGVLTVLDTTKVDAQADEFLRALFKGAGLSDAEIDEILAESREG
jgi:hypothetical protein